MPFCLCRQQHSRPGIKLGLMVLLLLLPISGWARQSVLLVLSQQSPAYIELAHAIEQQLPASHWQLTTQPQEQHRDDTLQFDLIITVGTRAARTVLRQAPSQPVLSVLIPRTSFVAIKDQLELSAAQQQRLVSAIYLEQPITRQMALASLIVPDMARLGVVLGPSSHTQQTSIENAVEARGWGPEVALFNNNDNPIGLIEPIVRHSDALLAVPGRAQFNRNISKWMLLLSYRQNIPLIGFSRRYVEAGATAALFSSPLTIATDTAQWLERWRHSGSATLPAAGYPHHFDIQINPKAAQKIGLSLPSVDEIRAKLSEDKKP